MGNINYLKKLANFMMRVAGFFVKLAIFLVVLYLIGIRLFDFGHRLFYEDSIDKEKGKEIVFEIKKGDSSNEIADNLYSVGLINDKLAFKFRAVIYRTKFTPNIYSLTTDMTIKNMLDIFDSPTEKDIAAKPQSTDVYQLSSEGDE